MMKFNTKRLKALGACSDAVKVYAQWQETDIEVIFESLIDGSEAFTQAVGAASKLNDNEIDVGERVRLQWGNWLMVRVLPYKDAARYAVFAAEQVLNIFETKYLEDKRPRKAIEAAKAWLENDTPETRNAVATAATVAYTCACACAAAAADAADAAAAAADAAAAAAAFAAAATAAAAYAYAAAYDAAYDAAAKLQQKILRYGMTLLGK